MNNLHSYELRDEMDIKERLGKHISENTAVNFDELLIEKIKNTNVYGIGDFFKIFEIGMNIHNCGITVRTLSFLFEDFVIISEGTCEILSNLVDFKDGKHSWLEVGEYIYDTTFMLKINKNVAYDSLGYVPIIKIPSYEIKKNLGYNLEKESSIGKKESKKTFEEFCFQVAL